MAKPNMSPASADDRPSLFIQLQTQNRSRQFTGSRRLTELENEQNDSSVIDLPDSNASSGKEIAYPLLLSFKSLSYSIKIRQNFLDIPFFGNKSFETKLLLDDISGVAREGEMMGILGASCSSKTALIDALAGRISKERLKGTVTMNGAVLGSRLLKIISAYVMQDDLLYPMLTVAETLMFSAEFRLPRSNFSKEKKQERVEALIDQLGLRSAADTRLDDEQHRGASGGERRRVSIGVDNS